MLRVLLKRLLWLLPTLFVLSILAFHLSQSATDDPVLHFLPNDGDRSSRNDPTTYERNYRLAALQLGLDRPPFYFSITNQATPDTLHRILQKDQRLVLRQLINYTGNWSTVQAYFVQLRTLARQDQSDDLTILARELLLQGDPNEIKRQLDQYPTSNSLIHKSWSALEASKTRGQLLIPAFHWHGLHNQYHHWASNVLRGDFGKTYLTNLPVAQRIWPALRWTALINGIAIIIAYLIAVPLGMYMAYYAGSRFDKLSTLLLFLFFSLPGFWVATMFSNFLTTPVYGLDLFPTMGVGEIPEDSNWINYLLIRLHHLFLPLICLIYPSLAYLSRQMRASTQDELGKPYVRTARLKGLGIHQILWRHVFRNAVFPIITMVASLLPALLAGSILIEIIFSIPGMGTLLIEAVLAADWPIVLAVLLLNGLLTIIGILLADLLYAIADPRLRKNQPNTVSG